MKQHKIIENIHRLFDKIYLSRITQVKCSKRQKHFSDQQLEKVQLARNDNRICQGRTQGDHFTRAEERTVKANS